MLIPPVLLMDRMLLTPRKAKHGVKLPALKGGDSAVRQCFAARKGNHLFKIASLHSALKGRACREASRPVLVGKKKISRPLKLLYLISASSDVPAQGE
jgi:hypothetical protein